MITKCKKNYYDILGVTPDSDENEVKTSYRNLARKYHPDVNKAPESITRFKDILEAYETLSDSQKRKNYDMVNGFYKTPKNYFKETSANKSEFKTKQNNTDCFTKTEKKEEKTQSVNQSKKEEQPNPKKTYTSKQNYKNGVDSILEEISKQHDKTISKYLPKNGTDINTEISISIFEALNGSERILNIMHKEVCPHCNGRKFLNKTKCPKCNGTGIYEISRKLTVKIPAGVKNNSKLRLQGEGNPGFFGGKNGDLFITLKIENDNNFEIKDSNISYTIPISPSEAVLGTEISVPARNSEIKLTIPPMTRSGQKFQIANKGIQTNGKFGDMIITVIIQIPKNLSENEINLYGKLKKMSKYDLREGL